MMPSHFCVVAITLALLWGGHAWASDVVDEQPLAVLAEQDVVWKLLPPKIKAEHDELLKKGNSAANEGRVTDERDSARAMCALLIRHRSPLYMHTNIWRQRYEDAKKICLLSPADQAVVHSCRLAVAEARQLRLQGKDDEARRLVQPAMKTLHEKVGESESYLMGLLLNCTMSPTPDEAEWRHCHEAWSRYCGAWHPLCDEIISTHGEVLARQGSYEEARVLLEQAREAFIKAHSTTSAFGRNCSWLAFVAAQQGRYREAEQRSLQAISMYWRSPSDRKHLYSEYLLLGSIYAGQGDCVSAIQAFESALRLPSDQRDSPRVATEIKLLSIYIQALRAERQDELAAQKEEELKKLEAMVEGGED